MAGQDLATHNGIFLKLTSPTTGPNSSIRLLHHPHDAAEMIFGIPRRKYFGQPATAAQLFVEPTLNEQGTLNVWARHLLRLGVDGHAPITIDLRAEADNPTALSLDLLANLLQQKVPGLQAVSDGQRLTLASQYIGSGSALKVEPVRTVRRTRFTTSAPLVNEATTSILGFITARATGSDALPARIVGRRDFSRGLDLSSARYLRLTVDGKPL